jgi:hypothetical protein
VLGKLLSRKGAIRGTVAVCLWLAVTLFFLLIGIPKSVSAPTAASLPSLATDLKSAQTQLTEEDIELQRVIELLAYWTSILEQRAPEYVWGGSDPDVITFDTKKKAYRKGTDCSGSMFWIFRKSGFPFPRVTSNKMYLGMGWPGYNVDNWRDTMFPDLIFFTFSSDRPAGHVGLVKSLEPKTMTLKFSEASSKANKFKVTSMRQKDFHDENFQAIRILDLLGKPKGPQKETPRGVK